MTKLAKAKQNLNKANKAQPNKLQAKNKHFLKIYNAKIKAFCEF